LALALEEHLFLAETVSAMFLPGELAQLRLIILVLALVGLLPAQWQVALAALAA
jgi:hypothetical protein